MKKVAVQILTKGIGYGDPESSPTPPIPKSHPEFNDLYSWVYKGAAYALVSLHQLVECVFLIICEARRDERGATPASEG